MVSTVKPSIRGRVPARARFIYLLIIPYVRLINGCLAKLREINCDNPDVTVACQGERNTHKPKETRDGERHQGKLQLPSMSFTLPYTRAH